MRRLLCLLVVLALCLALAGCGKTISSEKAIDIAMEELNLSRITTPRTDAVLDKTTSPQTYKVTVYETTQNDIVIVNAETGEVISVEIVDAQRN